MRPIEAVGISVVAIGIGLFQSVFSSFLPMPWAAFQPALLIVVYLTLRGGLQKALLFSVLCGFLADAFTPGIGGFFLFRYLLVTLMLSALATGLLTNRSLLASLTLNVSAHLVDWLLLIVFLLGATLFVKDAHFIMPSVTVVAVTFAWDAGIIVIAYLLRALFGKRFVFFANAKRNRYG